MPDTAHHQVQRQLFLRTFFEVSPPAELAELLAERMRDRRFAPDEVLFERGQPPGPMFFVTSGTISMEAPGEEPWVFEGQSFVGAIDANSGQPHPRTARALTPVSAIEIHFEEYLMLLEDFFDFARATLIQGAQRTMQTALRLAPDGVLPPPRPSRGRWLPLPHLDQVQRLVALRDSDPFGRAPVQALVSLARASEEVRASAGERILGAGDEPTGVDLLIDGRAEVTHDEPQLRAEVGQGQFLFGVSAIVPAPNPFSAWAKTDCVLLRVPHEELFDAMEEHFGLLRSWWTYMGRENHRAREELGRRGLASGDRLPAARAS